MLEAHRDNVFIQSGVPFHFFQFSTLRLVRFSFCHPLTGALLLLS